MLKCLSYKISIQTTSLLSVLVRRSGDCVSYTAEYGFFYRRWVSTMQLAVFVLKRDVKLQPTNQ